MYVINQCSYAIIAFCWDDRYGYGQDVRIESGEVEIIPGPIKVKDGDHHYREVMKMQVKCMENADNVFKFQVLPGEQLCIGHGPTGITIRHHSENREIQDATTHCGQTFHIDTRGCVKFGFTSGERVWVVRSNKYAVVRGTSKKPLGLKIPCKPDLEEVLWIRVDGEDFDSLIFDPGLSLKKL